MSSIPSASPLPRLLQEVSFHLQHRSFAQAQALLEHAARLAPQLRDVQMLQAILAVQTRQHEQAEQLLRGILERDPVDVDALANLGFLLLQTQRNQEAAEWLERAVQLQPDHAGLHLNLGVALAAVDRPEEARQSYERSLTLNPQDAQTHFALGRLLQDQQDFSGAMASYQNALAIEPAHAEAMSSLLFSHHYAADFHPQAHHDLARRLATAVAPPAASGTPAAHPDPRPAKSPLRIGLVSADLREHPVSYFLEGLLAQLDRARFSLFAYSNNIFEDAVSERLKPHFVQWRVIEALNDPHAAALIREDEIDVLIDLSGYTAGHRQGLFALRPAPLQVSWLGYFSTTGQSTIDYVLADPVSVPQDEEQWFVERVWRLPTVRYCFTPPAQAPDSGPLPALDRGYFTFGSFQALSKINDRVLRCWAEIVRRAPMVRLRIQSKQLSQPSARSRFESRLKAAGLPLEQVQLVGRQSRTQYLEAYREVDLILDTFPYPGGTTTAEALWMGVPTLTLAQPGMLGRQGQSLLQAAGLPHWAPETEDDYVAQAVLWAQAGMQQVLDLAELRAGLREKLRRSALFDTARFARDFESAITGMWQAPVLSAVSSSSPLPSLLSLPSNPSTSP